jgi:hypothetical protein
MENHQRSNPFKPELVKPRAVTAQRRASGQQLWF